jgi:hypothetical protein
MCYLSKPSASGKAVDSKGKGKQYFLPSFKAKARVGARRLFLTYLLLDPDQVQSSIPVGTILEGYTQDYF